MPYLARLGCQCAQACVCHAGIVAACQTKKLIESWRVQFKGLGCGAQNTVGGTLRVVDKLEALPHIRWWHSNKNLMPR